MNEDAIPKPNMTPMIDVVFQLLIFFLVSMKFKTLDMKIEAFLPDNAGVQDVLVRPPETVDVVARLKRSGTRPTRVTVNGQALGGAAEAATWAELTRRSRIVRERHLANGGDPAHVRAKVDADPRVDTGDVVRAIDAFLAADLENVTFVGTNVAALPPDQLPSQR